MNRKWGIALWMLWMSFAIAGCGNDPLATLNAPLPAGLLTQDLHVGTGPHPLGGQTVTISYSLSLADGTFVESTVQRGRDFSWRFGSGEVISGLEVGIASMNVGGHRKVTIPPNLAYGATGSPPAIPPNATIVYDLWLSSAN